MQDRKTFRLAAGILGGIAMLEGIFVIPPMIERPQRFFSMLGFLGAKHPPTPLGWTLGLIVAILFVLFSCRLPSVRVNLIRPSLLKLVAVALANIDEIIAAIKKYGPQPRS